MVYMTLPKQLTDSELELQRKFAQLRKLKKQLAALKAASSRPEETEKKDLKRTNSEAAEAATEQAKKLLKSGAIKLDASNREKRFKRARLEKSAISKDAEKQSQVAAYKPYNSSDIPDEPGYQSRPSIPSYRDSFVPASSRGDNSVLPKRGPRVFVRGDKPITEAIVRRVFVQTGNVMQISMESNRHSGFVTFDTVESADEAVAQLNGSSVEGIKLEVEIARKQKGTHHSRLPFEPGAQPRESKVTSQPDRDMVSYEDDLFGEPEPAD